MLVTVHDQATLEPLNVIDVDFGAYMRIREGDPILYQFTDEPLPRMYTGYPPPVEMVRKTYRIVLHPIQIKHNGHVLFVLCTGDRETAMKIPCAYLPGQKRENEEDFLAGVDAGVRHAMEGMLIL